MIDTIIFDLDGTIVDSMPLIKKIINQYAGKFGFSQISDAQFEIIRNEKPQEALKNLHVPLYKLPFFVTKVRNQLHKEISSVKLHKGIKKTIVKLKKNGFTLGIVTSNSQENVEEFLHEHGMNVFDFIHSGGSIFGKHKILQSILKQRRLQKKEVLYVGDETRDIEAARKAGITIVSVSWGFNTKHILSALRPDYLIDNPEDLYTIVMRL